MSGYACPSVIKPQLKRKRREEGSPKGEQEPQRENRIAIGITGSPKGEQDHLEAENKKLKAENKKLKAESEDFKRKFKLIYPYFDGVMGDFMDCPDPFYSSKPDYEEAKAACITLVKTLIKANQYCTFFD